MTISVNDVSGFLSSTTNPGYLLAVANTAIAQLQTLGVPTDLVSAPTIQPVSFRSPIQLDYARLASGSVFFVNSNSTTGSNASGYGLTPDAPFLSIAYAMTQCTAAVGDLIVVAAGHAESVASAGAIACSKSGVTVLGLGNGLNKPLITFATSTAASITVTAANVTWRGVNFKTIIDELVVAFSVSAAYLTIEDCEWIDNTSTAQALSFLLTTAAGTDLKIQRCKFVQSTAAAGTQRWIELVGADRADISDNVFRLALSDVATCAVIKQTTTLCKDIRIARNDIVMTGYTANLVSAILLGNTTTGNVLDNRIGSNVAANTTINDAPGCYSFNNLCTNAVDKSGIVDPVVDT